MTADASTAWKRRLGIAAGAAVAMAGVAITLIGGLVGTHRQSRR